jgi:hypothetical protein
MNTKEQKVVLVDIFPRESKKAGDIPMGGINTNKLDVHAVLLYKAGEDKILAIDPSNPMFSTHLSKYKGIETLCSTDDKYKIYSPISKDSVLGKEIIKKFQSITGYSKEQYRDCIDIAVKLGLLLNLDQTQYTTIEKIIGSEVAKLVTNNPLIDKLRFKNEELVRTKQSSNHEKMVLINKQMKEISEKIIKEDLEYKEKIEAIEKQHFLALNELAQNKVELIGKVQTEYFNEYSSDDF